MADLVQVEFGAKIDALLSGVDNAKRAIESVRDSTDRVTEGGRRLLEVFGIAFSLEAIKSFIENMADLGLQTERTSAMLGAQIDTVTEWQGLAKLTGTSVDGLALSIERMSLNIQRSTATAINPQAQALTLLGLNAKQLIGLPVDQYFDKLRDAVSKFNPSLNLTNAVMEIGGRGIAQLIPILQLSKERYEQMRDAVKSAQDGLSAAIPGMADTHVQLTLLSLSAQSLGARIFTVLKPALDLGIQALTRWVQSLDTKTIQEFAKALIDILGNAVISMITLFSTFGGTIDTLLSKMKLLLTGAAIGGAVGLLGGPGGVLVGALGGAGIASALGSWMEQFDNGTDKAKADVDRQKSDMVARIKSMMAAVNAAISGGTAGADHEGGGAPKANAGAIDIGIQQRLEAQAQAIQAEIALLRAGLEQKKTIYQLDADLWRTTDDQKFASTMRAAQQEFQAEYDKLKQIRDLWPAHSKEWEQHNRQMVQSFAQNQTEMVKLNADATRSMMTKFNDVFSAMQTSFNSSLRGLLAGTTTWTQAFRTLMGDMLIYFIQMVEKMVFNWLAGQAAQLFATQTTEASKTAAQVTAQEATLPVKIAAFMSALEASVALVYAGTAANLALALGPAAPAAAAAVSAEVQAVGLAGVPKAEQGAWAVKNTGMWMLHPEETVLPAPAAKAFRDMAEGGGSFGGGGGDNIHLHLIDTAGAKAFIAKYAQSLTHAVGNYRRENPSTR